MAVSCKVSKSEERFKLQTKHWTTKFAEHGNNSPYYNCVLAPNLYTSGGFMGYATQSQIRCIIESYLKCEIRDYHDIFYVLFGTTVCKCPSVKKDGTCQNSHCQRLCQVNVNFKYKTYWCTILPRSPSTNVLARHRVRTFYDPAYEPLTYGFASIFIRERRERFKDEIVLLFVWCLKHAGLYQRDVRRLIAEMVLDNFFIWFYA